MMQRLELFEFLTFVAPASADNRRAGITIFVGD